MSDGEAAADKAARAKERREVVKAQTSERKQGFKMPNGAVVKACGGGTQHLEDV